MLRDIGKLKSLWERFSNREYRHAYLEARLRESVASQIFFIRESKKLTQSELATLAGTKQPAISRMEKGESSLSVKSLEAIARAFDVALSIKFVPFSEIAEDVVVGRIEAYVPPFSDDAPALLQTTGNHPSTGMVYMRVHGNKNYVHRASDTVTGPSQMVRAG